MGAPRVVGENNAVGRYLILVVLAACGRVGFDSLVDGAGAPGDGTASACPAFAVLCDDFETGDLSKWTATDTSVGGQVVVDSVEAHSGTFALDAKIAMTTDGAISAICSQQPTVSAGMLAVREWIYSPALPPTNYDEMIILSNLSSCTDNGTTAYSTLGCDNNNNWETGDSSTAGLFSYVGSPCVAADTWICIETDYTLGSTPRVQIYIDDALMIDHATADPAPMFSQVYTGVARADMVGFHVIVDDVVIAHQHIGCP